MGASLHLSEDRIQAIYAAPIATGLAAQQDVLLAGLPSTYATTLPIQGPPAARLLETLHTLNGVRKLTDGTVPLAVWLRNAAALTAALPDGRVFKDAQEDIRSGRRKGSR